MIEVLDLFSAAAGGWSLGMHRAGFVTMAACEAVDWRRALYAQNNPGVKVYDDVRTLTAERILGDFGRLPSVVVGSPPCQDISSKKKLEYHHEHGAHEPPRFDAWGREQATAPTSEESSHE